MTAAYPADALCGATVPAEAVAKLIHDLNSLLSPSMGFTQLLAVDALPLAQRPAALRAIGEAGDMVAARLTLATAELLPEPLQQSLASGASRRR